MRYRFLSIAALILIPTLADAAVQTKTIKYKHGS